jgi:hypothetical protein
VESELLAELFSSRVRAAVLGHLLLRPHLGFSLTDLSRRLDLPISSLQHECYKLARLGVLRDARAGGSRLYAPNLACPLLAPLTQLVIRAVGVEAALTAAVEEVAGLELAMLAGALAPVAGFAGPRYLVLVGELPIEAVDGAFARVATALAAVDPAGAVELAFYRPAEWRARRDAGNAFLAGLQGGSHLVLRGPRPQD